MKINANNQYKTTTNVKKDQQSVDKNKSSKEEKETSLKYRLVGTMIKVMLCENGVETTCIKSIPVETAPPEIIAQVENLTFLDMIMINEIKNEKQMPDENTEGLPKEHAEYEKHSDYGVGVQSTESTAN